MIPGDKSLYYNSICVSRVVCFNRFGKVENMVGNNPLYIISSQA